MPYHFFFLLSLSAAPKSTGSTPMPLLPTFTLPFFFYFFFKSKRVSSRIVFVQPLIWIQDHIEHTDTFTLEHLEQTTTFVSPPASTNTRVEHPIASSSMATSTTALCMDPLSKLQPLRFLLHHQHTDSASPVRRGALLSTQTLIPASSIASSYTA